MTFDYDGLRLFYNHTIHPELLRMDVRRRKLLRMLLWSSVLILVVVIIALALQIFVLTLFLTIPITLYMIYLYGQIRKFQKTFKPHVVRLILDFIDNDVNFGTLYYDEGRAIDIREFRYSQIFSEDVVEYTGEDYINGVVGELAFELCELEAKAFSRVRSKIDTVFRGVFLHAEFKDFKKRLSLHTQLNDITQKIHLIKGVEQLNHDLEEWVLEENQTELNELLVQKEAIEYDLNTLQFNEEESNEAVKIKGKILIIPREYKNSEIRSIKKFLLSGAEEVSANLQLDEFKELFMTFATPDAPIHSLLSEEMQNDILDYYDFTGCRMYLSVIGNDIYIAIDEPNDLLEPSIFQSNVSYDLVREFYEKLTILISIVSDFDENN
jgi:Protein of unknown function (DUF3137)